MKAKILILLFFVLFLLTSVEASPRQTKRNPLGLYPRVTSTGQCYKRAKHKYRGNRVHSHSLFNSNKIYSRR